MMQILSVVTRARSCRRGKVGSRCRTALLTLVFILGLVHAVLAGGFVTTAAVLNVARENHTATLLTNGRVIFTGGTDSSNTPLTSAEIFDPTTEQCTKLQSSMQSARAYHTATLLNDGRVLIVGGAFIGGYGNVMTSTAEIFDPTNGTFTSTGSMGSPRGYHTATLLANGMVLITGGKSGSSSSTALASAEVYNPSTGTFTATSVNMNATRFGHTATRLSDGRVLVAGGASSGSADIYNPTTGNFTATGAMASARSFHTATLLQDNTVLITGGQVGLSLVTLGSAEIYSPSAGTFAVTTNAMNAQRQAHQANLLANGKVFISGGSYYFGAFPNTTQYFLNSTEQYEYPDSYFSTAPNMNSDRYYHTATTLADGASVLVAGGADGTTVLSSIQIYNSGNLEVRPLAWSFGNTQINTQQSHSFTVTNSLSSALSLTIGFSGTDAGMFSASGCSSVPASGSCTVTVTFTPTSPGNKQASLTVTDTIGDAISSAMTGTGFSLFQVTVNALGNGSGTVTSTPAGINCALSPSSPSCSANLPSGQITLAANPSGSPVSSSNASYFSGWAGPTGCSGNTCIFTLSGPTAATASFYLYPVTIGKTTYYATLQDAYNGAASGNQILLAASYNVSQSVNFGMNIPVVVKGGYDSGFGSVAGYSTIGPLTIGLGSAVADSLIIQ